MAADTSSIKIPDAKASIASLSDFLLATAGPSWEAYVEHPFVTQLEAGTLPLPCFLYFIRQGYRFLLHYARAHAIAAHKAKNLESLAASSAVVQSCIAEVAKNVKVCPVHLLNAFSSFANHHYVSCKFCEANGISKGELEETHEGVVTVAYSRYILDLTITGDTLDMQVALLPCLVGYAAIGTRLLAKPDDLVDRSDRNPYYKWIVEYAGQEYQEYARIGREQLESTFHEMQPHPQRIEDLQAIFRRATELEIAFWDAALAACKP